VCPPNGLSKAKLKRNGDEAVEQAYGKKNRDLCQTIFCSARYVALNQKVSDNAGILKVSFEFSHLCTH
jgi:hypothetical protein